MNKVLHIKYKNVVISSLALMVVPVLIFYIGWLKPIWSILFGVVLCVGTFFALKKLLTQQNDTIDIPLVTLVVILLMLFFWVAFAGNCGVSVSNYDTKWRTAMLRDLVNHSWPVYYENSNSYFVYYHIFWMIPAVIGKIWGFQVALIAQLVYMTLIIFDSFLLITKYVGAQGKKYLYMVTIFLLFWSGLNCLGSVIMETLNINLYSFGVWNNEEYCDALFNGESFNFFYRSNQDFLSNPYNQLVVWIVVPLMLICNDISVFAYLGLLLFPFSPWGTVGVALIMLLIAAPKMYEMVKSSEIGELVKSIFSVPNICGLISFTFVFLPFFMSSSRLEGETGPTFGILTLSKFDLPRIVGLLVFWLCEFGIYYILTWKKYKHDYLYKAMLPFLMLIPLGWVGTISGRDFCMNVSYPFLFVLMIYVIRYTKDEIIGKLLTLKRMLFIIAVFIAFCTPVFYILESVNIMIDNRSMIVQDDTFYTFDDKPMEGYENFLNDSWEDSFFFNYLAKDHKE